MEIDERSCTVLGLGWRVRVCVKPFCKKTYFPRYFLVSRNLYVANKLFENWRVLSCASALCSVILQRLEVQYDAQLRCESKSLQLRSVAALTDEVQLSLLQVIDFILLPENNNLLLQPLDQPDKKELSIFTLSQHPKNFAAVLPAFSDIVRFCEPALTWLLVRATLNPIYSLPDSVPENEVVAEAELRIPGTVFSTAATLLFTTFFCRTLSFNGNSFNTFSAAVFSRALLRAWRSILNVLEVGSARYLDSRCCLY